MSGRRADEHNLGIEVTRSGHGAIDDHGRRVVTAHGVDRDAHAHAAYSSSTGRTCRSL